MPKTIMWLMIEVIIFYAYIFLECVAFLAIFVSMYCDHRRQQREERERAEEAAASLAAADNERLSKKGSCLSDKGGVFDDAISVPKPKP